MKVVVIKIQTADDKFITSEVDMYESIGEVIDLVLKRNSLTMDSIGSIKTYVTEES